MWVDENSNTQISKQSLKDLTKISSKNVRQQRTLKVKLAWTNEHVKPGSQPMNMFGKLLFEDYSHDVEMLTRLAREKKTIEKEIELRNCMGIITASIKKEVELCLGEGYELENFTTDSAVLKRSSPHLGGCEILRLGVDSSGNVQRKGEGNAVLQERLDTLISMFDVYRDFRPTPGREKSVLDKQFQLDSEIKALCIAMKHLGYSPNRGDYS